MQRNFFLHSPSMHQAQVTMTTSAKKKKLSNNITKGCRGDHNASIACAGRAGG